MLARLSVLCAGALLLASSSVHAAALNLTARTELIPNMAGFGFVTLADGARSATYEGNGFIRFTVRWDVDPADQSVIAVSCADPDQTFPSSVLTDPGANLTFTTGLTLLDNSLNFPTRTTAVNRLTHNLVTCTATLAGYTPGQTTFYVGGTLATSNDVPGGVAAPGASYNMQSWITPNVTVAVLQEPTSLTLTCGGVGTLNATALYWTPTNGSDAQTIMWTAPAIPQSPIRCTYVGPTPADPATAWGLFDYYTKSVEFTMTLPTITLASFTGTVTTGADTAVTITLSASATDLQLTATCSAGGSPYGTIPAFTVSGTTATFNIGSTLTAAATGVTCTLARTGGDAFYTNAVASNSVGPFTAVVAATSSSSTADAASSSSGPGGASSSTAPECGVVCAAPASLRAGLAMIVLAAAAIVALMQ